ncbi:lytic transglycosylase domain-containing protein [Solirhodobacter olei]|uniref:lytic transglycosylase domain-containing protein n=1 Tax=Solirhodobacter olei TaxID=2493082 RepID=UPI000FDB7502|nr:lytic transglycosylase domain-containing protein [Solirhodobacter olei]
MSDPTRDRGRRGGRAAPCSAGGRGAWPGAAGRGVVLALAAGLFLAPGAGAPAAAGFTFRMVKPPAPGTKKFITVQIDPAEQAKELAALPPVPQVVTPAPAPPPAGTGVAGPMRYAWFWKQISPALGAGAGRFTAALQALTQGPEGQNVATPRLADVQGLATRYGRDILAATVGTRVSPALVLAVMAVESDGNPKAVSPLGAQGLMQLMPATAKRFDVTNVFSADQNIKGGVAYLNWLMKKFHADPLMVLAGYNAGEQAVISAGGVPTYAETRDYVPKVLAAWTVTQGLCLTPPELVSDGCVFRTIAAGGEATADIQTAVTQ